VEEEDDCPENHAASVALVADMSGHDASNVSKNSNYVVVGLNAGSRLANAKTLGVIVTSEDEFAGRVKKKATGGSWSPLAYEVLALLLESEHQSNECHKNPSSSYTDSH
jgi:BRCT domain type II-containing protein